MRNTCLFKLGKAKTFRRTSTKFFDWGGNQQNIDKPTRSIYMSDGWSDAIFAKLKYWLETGDTSVFTEEELVNIRVMLQVDQSGAEALVVAFLCKPGKYRQLFENNIKPHVYVAMKLFKDLWPEEMIQRGGIELDMDILDITPIPKLKLNPQWKELDSLIKDSDNWSLDKRYYYLGKQTAHSGNYGIRENTFRGNILEKSGGKIVVSKEQAKHFLGTYRGEFPEIPEWNEEVIRIVDEVGILYNLHGHPYQITAWRKDNYKDYIAWVPQSTVGEITRIAFCNLQEYIEEMSLKWDLLNDCHDSYLCQCPLIDVAHCRAKMQEYIAQSFISPVDGVEFTMKSECQLGFNWSPFDRSNPEKNPLGLRELSWKN